MTRMIERVARAIYETEPFGTAHGHAVAWSAVAESQKEGFRIKARDVIKAMREPTDLMGLGLPPDYKPGSHSATQIWRAMIDRALAE